MPTSTTCQPPTTNRIRGRDTGNALPLVIVFVFVLSGVVLATATYATTVMRYGQTSESRANTLAAAQSAMDDALEQLRLKRSICTTAAGNTESGVTYRFPEDINDAVSTVTCRIIGGNVPPADGWALVVTGDGPPLDNGKHFEFTLGGTPSIGGPVYVEDLGDVAFSQATTIVDGDLWHRDPSCAGPELFDFRRSGESVPNLRFDPATRGTYCLNATWRDLFSTVPPVPDLSVREVFPLNPEPTDYASGCRVFSPGVYTVAPRLGRNNYFRSGNYLFRDLGTFSVKNAAITMGHINDLEGFPATENAACDSIRLNDAPTGSTLYLDGSTSIQMEAGGSLEVSRKAQGTSVSFPMSVQALDTSNPVGGTLLSARDGAQKELSIQGMLWAPSSRLAFGTVPAQKAAVLRGGGVVGTFSGGITNAAIGFVLEVPTSQAATTLRLDATAVDGRTTTTVRVVADYRPSSGELAVASWRVVG